MPTYVTVIVHSYLCGISNTHDNISVFHACGGYQQKAYITSHLVYIRGPIYSSGQPAINLQTAYR